MIGPKRLVDHLAAKGYHPRSDAHSNAICLGILDDLLDHCPAVATKAGRGELVATLNHTVIVNYQRWNIDLALGPPPGSPSAPLVGKIAMATPAVIQIAVEVKGVMTEHGKARHNRLRDLQAFHSHAHLYDLSVVAVGVIVVNISPTFWSPTRDDVDVTQHRGIVRLGKETVDLYRNLPLRNDPTEGPGLEAAAVVVVNHDNLSVNPLIKELIFSPQEPELVTASPSPPAGDPLNYSTMIHRMCRAFERRWV
ncbi:hypothetical protein BH20GEM1_BH20GEM1_19640 [soil metagenome]